MLMPTLLNFYLVWSDQTSMEALLSRSASARTNHGIGIHLGAQLPPSGSPNLALVIEAGHVQKLDVARVLAVAVEVQVAQYPNCVCAIDVQR